MSTSCIIRELNWSRCLSRTSRWLLEFWEYYLDYSVCLERAFGFFNFNEATGLALESSMRRNCGIAGYHNATISQSHKLVG